VVISKGGPQSTRADDADAMRPVETENLGDVIAQVCDIIADATDAKFAKVAQVFSDLSGV
jgi:hypothetical protein